MSSKSFSGDESDSRSCRSSRGERACGEESGQNRSAAAKSSRSILQCPGPWLHSVVIRSVSNVLFLPVDYIDEYGTTVRKMRSGLETPRYDTPAAAKLVKFRLTTLTRNAPHTSCETLRIGLVQQVPLVLGLCQRSRECSAVGRPSQRPACKFVGMNPSPLTLRCRSPSVEWYVTWKVFDAAIHWTHLLPLKY